MPRRAVRLIAVTSIMAAWCVSVGSVANADGGPGLHPPLPLPLRVLRGFAPPTHPWEPGNRGVDLAARVGEPVYAAMAGIVVYAGPLAGRGVVSVKQGDLRTTYEPVDPVVSPGDHVIAGQLLGRLSYAVDHCGPPGSCLHWGAIQGRVYVDPMRLLGAPRVRLLPIWSDVQPDGAPALGLMPPPGRPIAAVAQPAQLFAALGLPGKVIGAVAEWVMPTS
jgi:hypothetical protein